MYLTFQDIEILGCFDRFSATLCIKLLGNSINLPVFTSYVCSTQLKSFRSTIWPAAEDTIKASAEFLEKNISP